MGERSEGEDPANANDARIDEMLGFVQTKITELDEAPDENAEDSQKGLEKKTDSEEKKPAEEKPAEDPWEVRYKNLDKVFQRQAQEIGELRKMVMKQVGTPTESSGEPPQKDPKYLDKFVADPQAAIQAELDRRAAIESAKQMQEAEVARQNIASVYDKVPDFDSLRQTILELAKEDGLENPTMENIDYSLKFEPIVAMQYAKRAKLAQQLAAASNKGKEMIDKMAKGSRQAPVVTGKTGVSVSKEKLTAEDIHSMSDADLKAYLAKKGYKRS